MPSQLMRTTLAAAALSAALLGDASAQQKPHVVVLATGGTIAGAGSASDYGYKAGAFKIDDLIKAVPQLNQLARLSGEQVANIGSQDMNDKVWIDLATRTNALLSAPGNDGV